MSASHNSMSENELNKGIKNEITKPTAKKLKERNDATQDTLNQIMKGPLANGTAVVTSCAKVASEAKIALDNTPTVKPAAPIETKALSKSSDKTSLLLDAFIEESKKKRDLEGEAVAQRISKGL